VWRTVRGRLVLDGLVTHTLQTTVASFLDDAHVSTRKISDQLGHARVSMTQDHYLSRGLTDRETAEALERIIVDQGAYVSQECPERRGPRHAGALSWGRVRRQGLEPRTR
jgi:hypothetical protein